MRSGCCEVPPSNARSLPNFRTTMRSSGQRVVRAILLLALLVNGTAATSSDSRELTRPSNLGEQPAHAYGLRRVLASDDRGQLATGDFASDSNLLVSHTTCVSPASLLCSRVAFDVALDIESP